MGEKIIIGPLISKGLRKDVEAFNLDNNSFSMLLNAYQWRGRIKRKRGTSILGRLKRFFNSNSVSYSSTSITAIDGLGNGNILTGFSLQANGNIIPGSVTLTGSVGPTVYTDPLGDGFLSPASGNPLDPNTINYSTGAIHITFQANNDVTAIFNYYPSLPALGIENLQLISTQFPGTLAFDNKYAYNVVTAQPYPTYDISFYKNPAVDPVNLPGYIPKTNPTPTTWNGQDYQQFWGENYAGAFWVTNGINIPFNTTNIGMQFNKIVAVTNISAGPPMSADLQIANHGLVVGDFLYINEVLTTTGINFQTGYVIVRIDANNVTVAFPNATIATNGTGGIAQYLTNRSDPTKDCLRFYDGDPTDGNFDTPTLTQGHGWVNFCPPLSQFNFPLADLPEAIYYLVGARMIRAFKDRLLFLGVVVQNSGGGVFYLQDTIVYSQNGTPFYTSSYVNTPTATNYTPTSASNVFFPLLVPDNQTAAAPAYFEDSTGFGGFVSAGIAQPITTSASQEDVLIIGLATVKTRLVYTGNDIIPFNFYVINSELGDASTFSAINMEKGVISRGTRGFTITSQVESQRIDLEIPDEVFQIKLTDNGNERFCATRDFISEWIYFTYPCNTIGFRYPNQTLLYNYRDNTWAIFRESYTCYAVFRRQSGFTWQTVGLTYPTWNQWNEPWSAGESTLLQQEVLSGNQQGFLIFKDEGTGEASSLYIRSISGNTITSPDHNLENGNFIIINSTIGDVSTLLNGKIFSIYNVTANTFQLNPDPGITTESYFGGGLITRMYVPFIQSAQFPPGWGMGRKTRIGVQQYLFSKTFNAQITLLIYLSQNAEFAYNDNLILPNESLIYSTILYTCPESTNLGLTKANTNLQMIAFPDIGASQQKQIWHRMNTSLLGDTVQIGFTLSDDQMRDIQQSGTAFAITNATKALNCVLTCSSNFQIGQLIKITEVEGMVELNGNTYQIINRSATTVTIDVDSTTFKTYTGGGIATPVAGINGFAEIEFHGAIIDVSPSSLLA